MISYCAVHHNNTGPRSEGSVPTGLYFYFGQINPVPLPPVWLKHSNMDKRCLRNTLGPVLASVNKDKLSVRRPSSGTNVWQKGVPGLISTPNRARTRFVRPLAVASKLCKYKKSPITGWFGTDGKQETNVRGNKRGGNIEQALGKQWKKKSGVPANLKHKLHMSNHRLWGSGQNMSKHGLKSLCSVRGGRLWWQTQGEVSPSFAVSLQS